MRRHVKQGQIAARVAGVFIGARATPGGALFGALAGLGAALLVESLEGSAPGVTDHVAGLLGAGAKPGARFVEPRGSRPAKPAKRSKPRGAVRVEVLDPGAPRPRPRSPEDDVIDVEFVPVEKPR